MEKEIQALSQEIIKKILIEKEDAAETIKNCLGLVFDRVVLALPKARRNEIWKWATKGDQNLDEEWLISGRG